ncbi:baculoviral IAP repeat-containing protein 3-like [Mercenaria mercenaria]|uniref:baculoviral IAP repeat-containing protein 3-like n=1 Tax=Mercenaria mercenaria TaxID=6596 RepID=UPI00234ECE03|nr:baculoviral IAP repeat-containing protein 3-like [Mercenaria mercenaria]
MFYCEQKLSAILLCLVIIEFREILEIGNKELQHDVKNYSGSCLDSLQKSKVSQILSSSPNNVFKKRFEFGKNGNISLEPETFKIRTAHMKQKREHDCSEQNVDALRYIFLNGWKYKLSEFISLKIFNDKNTTRSLFNKCFRSTIPHIVALTTLVLYSVFSCLKSGFAPSSEPEIKPQKSYYSVFEFRCKPFLELTVYYFSLKKYLNEIDRKSDKNIGRMNHEWARYESFKTFPEESAVSSLRLAQAGFYFSGKGEEAVCFFCGLSNGKWTNKESVIELHKRLSPKCKFINGERTENVPIHGNGESEQNYGGACGGPEDFSENNTTRETEQIEHIQYSSEITRTRNEVSQQTEQNLEQTNTTTGNTYQNTLENERHSILQNGSSGQYSEYRPPEEIKRFPGITNEQPKHPDYATRSVRLSSFSQWQLGHVMKPEDLAEAGFFFCGTLLFPKICHAFKQLWHTDKLLLSTNLLCVLLYMPANYVKIMIN